MKVTIAVIFALTLFAVTLGLPAPRRDDAELIPLEPNPFGDQPIIDTGVMGGGWGNPFPSSFGSIFENIDSLMSRMRQQLETILKRFPLNRGNSTEEIPAFGFPTGFEPIPNIDSFDLGKGNSTSVTKVIDGHKVVINETEYKNEGDFGGTFFKVRIIDVKPDGEATTEKESEAAPASTQPPEANLSSEKDAESVESSIENEIPKSKEVRAVAPKNPFENIEIFDEIDASSPFEKIDPFASSVHYENPPLNTQFFVPIEIHENSRTDKIPETPSSSTVTTSRGNPERSENAESLESRQETESFEGNLDDGWENIETLDTVDDNSLNSGESFQPIDLSRDTYVNQILADAGAPTNPDAEVFFVPQKIAHGKEPIRFEKFTNPR